MYETVTKRGKDNIGGKEQNERRPCARSRSVKDNSVNGFTKEVKEESYSYSFIRSTMK